MEVSTPLPITNNTKEKLVKTMTLQDSNNITILKDEIMFYSLERINKR
ncbi:hypothetical protein [Niallia taxi]|nr:hypothetical protein [Niallia taxi]